METMKKIELGEFVRDKVSGVAGYVMARTERWDGTVILSVQPTVHGRDGKIPDWQHFDEYLTVRVRGKKKLERPARAMRVVFCKPTKLEDLAKPIEMPDMPVTVTKPTPPSAPLKVSKGKTKQRRI